MDVAIGAAGVQTFRGWVERPRPEADARLGNLPSHASLGGIESEGHGGSCLFGYQLSAIGCRPECNVTSLYQADGRSPIADGRASSLIACAFSSARYTGREPME